MKGSELHLVAISVLCGAPPVCGRMGVGALTEVDTATVDASHAVQVPAVG